jgi:Domain of unknown function (DUF4864)
MQARLRQAKLRMTWGAALVGGILAGAMLSAAFAAFALASAGIAVMRLDAKATMPPARLADTILQPQSLWQPIALKSENFAPREVSPRERLQIEHAVRMQIRAYAARDAEQAFAKLAPSTQRFFGRPDKFLRAIAQETPAMLDTRRFAFIGLEQAGPRIVQQVLITDSTGREWLAEFQLEQQTGSEWRIKGCVVQATPGQQAQSPSVSFAAPA